MFGQGQLLKERICLSRSKFFLQSESFLVYVSVVGGGR